ncbi:MAG: cyclopropane fatty-acyl-phospholipid synthase-like methyltransferase [Crocinitomicaceae bacterium]
MDLGPEELRKIYGRDYFHGEEYDNYVAEKESLQRNFQRRIKTIQKIIGLKNIQKVHEIGCAYGYFGEQLLKSSTASYIGYDISHEAVKVGKESLGLDLREEDYSLFSKDQATDVFIWDVIEHLNDPGEYLKKVHENLTKDGRVYITTGDIERRLPRWQKQNWRMIHPPTHLHYFSKRTLTELLEKHGFKVIHCSYPSISRSVHQIFYSLFMLKKKPGKFRKWMHRTLPKKWKVSINTFDILFMVAIKRNE